MGTKNSEKTLVGYDGHTIYWVYLKDQKKVIWMKNLCIFEDYESKFSTKFFNYSEDMLTFQEYLFTNNDNKQLKDLYLTCKYQKTKNAEISN